MTRIIKCVEAHYEAHEVPFGCTYEWHPAYTALECDCGEKSVLTGMSIITTGGCSADHSAFIRDIREREGQLREKDTRPWHHDAQEREEQHLRDEADHPKHSPWRYNDITTRNNE